MLSAPGDFKQDAFGVLDFRSSSHWLENTPIPISAAHEVRTMSMHYNVWIVMESTFTSPSPQELNYIQVYRNESPGFLTFRPCQLLLNAEF